VREPGAILLLSCYELGHQPIGLASPAATLVRAGFQPACLDLSVQDLDPKQVARASVVGISVPMHTALRIGVRVGRRVKKLNPRAHIVYYGLYAILNADYLLDLGGGDSVIGGEVEAPLLALIEGLARGGQAPVAGVGSCGHPGRPHLKRFSLPVPSRVGLPDLERYAHLDRDGTEVPAGYVELSRGCLHLCRHCPIPPVYNGRFFVVPREAALADVDQLVDAGAGHITFGDPDFLNGPGHVMAVVREVHRRHPGLTFDLTTKVENILRHRDLFPELGELGCAFVVSAIESLSDTVLAHLDKGHTRADVDTALYVLRMAGIPLRPTFVAFTPWSTASDYLDLLNFIESESLIDHVDPVQFVLRLLLPPGSLLLSHPPLKPWLGDLDQSACTYRWTHPDPRMDELHRQVSSLVAAASKHRADSMGTFYQVKELAYRLLDGKETNAGATAFPAKRERRPPPRLTEDWFC
jgi:radical SAM superfamily enzyme YgiQ (UPF0313 family)